MLGLLALTVVYAGSFVWLDSFPAACAITAATYLLIPTAGPGHGRAEALRGIQRELVRIRELMEDRA